MEEIDTPVGRGKLRLIPMGSRVVFIRVMDRENTPGLPGI